MPPPEEAERVADSPERGHGRDEPPARLERGPRRGPERGHVCHRRRGPCPKDDLTGQTVNPDAIDPPELIQRERGHGQEDRHPSQRHHEPGGRVIGDPIGGGAHLDRDCGGQCRVQASGQSQTGGQSLARLVRLGEYGAGILWVLLHRVSFHSRKYTRYFPDCQVYQRRQRPWSLAQRGTRSAQCRVPAGRAHDAGTSPTSSAMKILYLTVRERRPTGPTPPGRSTAGYRSSTPSR